MLLNCSSKKIVQLHGLPKIIVFDWDAKFMSYFWRSLWKMLNTKLKFSSTFQPQIDGQIEVVNQSLSDLLCYLVGEHVTSWDHILPMAEFAYNSSVNNSTGRSPFKIVIGLLLRKPIDLVPLLMEAWPSVEAYAFSKHIHDLHVDV